MNADAALHDVLQSVPLFAGRRVQARPMRGGLSNRSWRVDDDRGSYVLRVSSAAKPGGGGHSLELAIHQQAAAAGIAPAVRYADTEQGILVSEFVHGAPLDVAEMQHAAVREALGELLRRLHALPACGISYDAAGAAAGYRDGLRGAGADEEFAEACLAVVRAADTAEGGCPCHNDVVAANIILGDRLWLIDFEYAADNEPLFDLASLVAWHDMDGAAAERLLQAYAGTLSPDIRERFQLQLRRFDALLWLWLSANPPAPGDRGAWERQLRAVRNRIGAR